jgi:hypothetical protein
MLCPVVRGGNREKERICAVWKLTEGTGGEKERRGGQARWSGGCHDFTFFSTIHQRRVYDTAITRVFA